MKGSLLLAAASLSTAAPLLQRATTPPANPLLSFFVFGDSYSSTGFNITSAPPTTLQPFGFPPVGSSPDWILGNPLIANQSTANGPNWAQYLTAQLNTTVTLTYDFAISGASIPDGFTDEIENIFEPKYASLYSPHGCVPQNSLVPGGTCWNGNSSIFASFIGINDLNWCSVLFSPTPDVPFSKCFEPRLEHYFDLMDSLYETGARNFFFVNLPPMQRAPMVFQNGQKAINNYAKGVAVWNEQMLPQYVAKFTEAHAGVKTIIYDAHALFTELLDHPQWYGFKNNKCYSCIGCYNVTGCMWTNNYHPTTFVHERLANDMLVNLTSIGWPLPVATSS